MRKPHLDIDDLDNLKYHVTHILSMHPQQVKEARCFLDWKIHIRYLYAHKANSGMFKNL
jgi:hypothetical protein